MENILYPIFLFIFGSCFGSFLNVYRFRYPKSISIIYPGSFCPKCKKKIPWFFNIPIISWFFLTESKIFNTESFFRNKDYLVPKICLAAINAKKMGLFQNLEI